MKFVRWIFVVLVGALAFAACSSGPADHRVLFVGNSFTFGNGMPAMVEEIAEANGTSIDWEMVAIGGAYLDEHQFNNEVTGFLQSGEFDTVVFQEQSVITSVPNLANSRTIPAATALDNMADANGVRVIWFQTWGHKNGFAEVGHDGFTSMQDQVTATYDVIASRTGGTVAPVGEAFRHSLVTGQGVSLFHADGSHSSPAGSYLAALEITDAVILAPVAEAPSVSGVDGETAALLLTGFQTDP